ncbi:hypothetical protein SAMN02982996_01287 [Lonsdalea quercina]|uniref:Uncharacterized protein n=1 Tax=Lonsdalea quercina TaxID=71657 RepID=A0A1H3ZRB4_9GAMM|nr:hypothetical protein SAMN02982996_01287 [Lonsdalea quercina]
MSYRIQTNGYRAGGILNSRQIASIATLRLPIDYIILAIELYGGARVEETISVTVLPISKVLINETFHL